MCFRCLNHFVYYVFQCFLRELKENEKNLEIPRMIIFMLPIRLSDYRAVGL